jgi:CelD/BcsL family acetyltransferase involved in cellulose biosynthesis
VIELSSHEGIPASGSERTEWELLLDDDPDATIFQSPRYLATWHRILGQRATPRIHTIHRDGRLIGLVPEAHEREGTPTGPIEVVRFLGGTEVTDYLGPIARREDRDDVVDAYLSALAADRDWDEMVAGGLADDTGWADSFRAHAERLGLPLIEEAGEDVCPRIDIEGGYDTYLGRLPSKQRHELRRKTRKLARDVGDLRLVEPSEEQLDEALDRFFEMASETETEKGGFFAKDDMRTFFRALADEFVGEGVFRVHLLMVAGAPAAGTVSLVHGGEWGLYNSAFDQSLRQLAPGMVLVSELIRAAADEGCHVFDLLRGNEPYKYRFGAEDRVLRRLTIARR